MIKKYFITFFCFIAISGSLIDPAKSSNSKRGFGEGTAAFACFLLWEGYSIDEVESLISRFARMIEKSNFSEVAMTNMAMGYRKQVKITNDCDLKFRY